MLAREMDRRECPLKILMNQLDISQPPRFVLQKRRDNRNSMCVTTDAGSLQATSAVWDALMTNREAVKFKLIPLHSKVKLTRAMINVYVDVTCPLYGFQLRFNHFGKAFQFRKVISGKRRLPTTDTDVRTLSTVPDSLSPS